jgi:CRISPR-associated protein Cmr2
MTQHLLHIHIGPMQAFIAAARRTRDLWFGSWLMSELSKAAARAVAEGDGADALIFPAASLGELHPGSELSVANKIVAMVENPQAAAARAEAALRARLDELADIALGRANGPLETRETAVAQIKDLPEFYWVALPLPDEKEYANVGKKAENLLAARKNLRQFTQPSWGGSRPKSSLDGRRESVIPEEINGEKVSGDARKMYTWYKARAGEQLSGVDLLKRLGEAGDRKTFPSTSHMAAAPLRARLAGGNHEAKAAWDAYMGTLDNALKQTEKVSGAPHPVFGHADGALLFEARLRDFYGGKVPDSVTSALKNFYKKADAPIPYYTLLVGDGDFMGKTINNQKTPDAHRDFSGTLAGFGAEAKEIVEKHSGAVIYTGGDDVMALLPIHQAVQCTQELARTFQTKMADFTDEEGKSPTFSAGIAIFHHTEPLEDALQAAREAEQAAKSVKGKNALAVTEAKRSGAPRMVQGKWGELDKRLLHLAAFFQAEALPGGLAYQLRDMYLHLGGAEALKAQPDLRDVLEKEAGRIIKRKERTDAAQTYLTDNMVSKLGDDYTMTQIAHELIIAANLAQAMEQAGERLPLPPQEDE